MVYVKKNLPQYKFSTITKAGTPKGRPCQFYMSKKHNAIFVQNFAIRIGIFIT